MNVLWEPTRIQIEQANMTRFIKRINEKYHLNIDNYGDLYDWSTRELVQFWAAMWEFGEIIASQPWDEVLCEGEDMLEARWFTGARLNFAENLLRYRDEQTAIVFKGEKGKTRKLTYAGLYQQVAALSCYLRRAGVKNGDRIAGYLPNIPETIIAMLAASSIGAIWSSCSPDFGFKGVVDRFGQIEPRILFCSDGYYYNGKWIDSLSKVEQIAQEIASIEKIIIIPFAAEIPDIAAINKAVLYQDVICNDNVESSLNSCLLIIRCILCTLREPQVCLNVWYMVPEEH